MKTIKCVFILLVMTGTAADCSATGKSAATEKTDSEIVVQGNNKFALQLYGKLRAGKANLFFSPYSISTALAMTYAGARGQTETQMARVLHFPTEPTGGGFDSNKKLTKSTMRRLGKQQFHSAFGAIIKDLNARGEKGGNELTVANALWGQKGYGFLEEFLGLIKANYGGGLNEVDFVGATESARKTINAWVEKETRNKIKNLIGQGVLNSMTRLVLTNAVYFKGSWARQFKKDRTKEAPFTLLTGDKVDVPMMSQTAEFNYMEADGFQCLELPYMDDVLSMVIFLPKEFDSFRGFEKTLTADNLSQWVAKLRKRKVIVSVPKFKMTCQFGLAGVLKSMGMTNAFSQQADFSGMSDNRDLFISAVIHKAYVDVNEEGTEAAAATAVTMKLTAIGPDQIPVFRADHPFIFLIIDNQSGSILFIGRVMNPKA